MILPQLNQILEWLGHYGYAVLLPLSVIEGPIIAVLAGFLVSLGHFNFIIAYIVLIIGDLIGDTILYYLGRASIRKGIPSWLRFLGITAQRVQFIEQKYTDHPKKIFLIGKLSHGIGAAALFAAGAIKFPFGKYMFYNILPTLIKSLFLLVIGYYFGRAYSHIQVYLDYVAIIAGCVLVILYLTFIRYSNSYFNNENNHSN